MTLDWIKQQAKWVIGIFGIFILGGLLMMDQAGSYGADRQHESVGKVEGQKISTQRFQEELKNYVAGQQAQTGKSPEGLELAQIREGLFNFKVQSILMEKAFDNYQLRASREEMMDYVLKHPREVAGHIQRYRGYEELPPFLADSAIDENRYRNWLAQDTVYDRFSMRELEEQLKTSVIPQLQLQQIMKGQIHRTLLEEAFSASMRENKAAVKFYHVSTDSFPVSPDKFKEEDLKAYFEAHPDSFHFRDDAARLAYISIPLRPSAADSVLMSEFAKELKERVIGGEKFEDLAKDYSNDEGSAENGGRLVGLQGRSGLDPAFADAAFALDSGDISDPVLSQFGYHIIQLHDKKTVDSEEKVELSHILLKVAAGTETVDSLMEKAEAIRTTAQKRGLAAAAEEASIPLSKSEIFEKTNLTPLGRGYVQGVNSFAFSEFEAKEKISEPLQADDAIYLLERDGKFPKGRNFDRAKPLIANYLVKEEKIALAKKELEAQKTAITSAPENALPQRLGKAVLDSTGAAPVAADNWLAGFGYSSPTLFKVFTQPIGTWGPVLATDNSAVIAKVTEKAFLSDEQLIAKAQEQAGQEDPYQVSALYQEWVTQLPKTAKVANTMDMVFRN